MPLTILGLSGSLRAGSLNTALLHTAVARAPEGVEVRIHGLAEVPFYNGDLETPEGPPAPVRDLRDALAASDALLLAFPEYNWSVPAVLKNAIDWLSRGGSASPLHRKPTAMLSAAGGSGGRRAQSHMTDILGHNQVQIVDTSPPSLTATASKHARRSAAPTAGCRPTRSQAWSRVRCSCTATSPTWCSPPTSTR